MTHRIKPGGRYKLDPNGPVYENTLPHAIIVDRQPIHVGGRVEPKTVSFGPGTLFAGDRKVADVESFDIEFGGPIDLAGKRFSPFKHIVFDIETYPFDAAPYHRAAADLWDVPMRSPSAANRWMPSLCSSLGEPWPSPLKDSPFPAFQAPERPAEPEAPKAEPDTPAVATLKALLADRQREVGRRKAHVAFDKADVVDRADEIVEAERNLEKAKKDLAHAETVLAAAESEVETIVSDIRKLGGKVEAQS